MVYVGILSNEGEVIKEEDAYEYALKQITTNEEEKKEFVEWFFSGNWIEKDEAEIEYERGIIYD